MDYWRQRHFHSPGEAARFRTLLSWDDFNAVLERHWRETYRFRLALHGRDLEPADYADLDGAAPRVRSAEVSDFLRRGATLSFTAIDEVHQPLTRLAEWFEQTFLGSTQINVYVAVGSTHGLDLHRDDEEIIVLQVSGRKRWLLYGTTADPADCRPVAGVVLPAGAHADLVLRAGDLLYIPGGCYHLAIPLGEPTQHVTIGVKTDQAPKRRPSFALPWSAAPEGVPPHKDFFITLKVPVVGTCPAAAGSIRLHHAGRTYEFPRGIDCVLQQLRYGMPVAFARVLDALAGRLDADTVRMLVGMLSKHAVVSIDG